MKKAVNSRKKLHKANAGLIERLKPHWVAEVCGMCEFLTRLTENTGLCSDRWSWYEQPDDEIR